MPSIEREISRDVEFISKGGKMYRKTTIYHVIGNAKVTNLDDDDNTEPSINEFKEALNPDKGSKDGYISQSDKSNTVS